MGPHQKLAVAHGNLVRIVELEEEEMGGRELAAHQKNVLKVRYDVCKDRLITGGLDSHLKFFSASDFKVAYNIKTPSEVYSLDFSSDGNHYALGLNDSSLLVRSRVLLKDAEEDEEEKMFKLESGF